MCVCVLIWGPGIVHEGNLEVSAPEKATGLRQATTEACRVWKPALGTSLSALRRIYVNPFQLVCSAGTSSRVARIPKIITVNLPPTNSPANSYYS